MNFKGAAALYWGPDRRVLYNDAYGAALGDRHPWAFGRPVREALPDMAPVLEPRIAQVLRTGEGSAIENLPWVVHRHGRDESTVWTYSFAPLQGEGDEPVGVLLFATETTDQKRIEALATQAGMRLQTALRLAKLGTFDWNVTAGTVEVDARGREIYALPPDGPILAADIFARVAPEEADRVRTQIGQAIALDMACDVQDSGRPFDIDCDVVHPGGARLSIESSGSIVQGLDGARRMVGIFRDVTDLRRAQAQLRAQNVALGERVEERTAERDLMWETSPDLMLVIDFDGVFRRVNPAWTRLLGYTSEELTGHHVNEFVMPQDHTETIEAYTEAAAGGQPRLVNRYRHKDGSTRWISWTAAPAGDLTYATGRDITTERQRQTDLAHAQEALRQSQKLEAIGQLTGGVAHDFNNLLTVVKSSAELLKRPDLTEDRRVRYVKAIADTVERAAKLTAQLLAFARRQALRPEVFAVCASVRSLSSMMETLIGPRIGIVTDLPEHACFVNADASQFDTALVNIAINARDAMGGQGRLSIRVEPVDAMPAIRAHAEVPGAFVAVSIGDTGSGIPFERLDQVFEPFFTTKAVGSGTGLGLSQVFGFAKQSGGDVIVESTVGQGSTFTLYLPRVEAPRQTRQQDEPEALTDGSGTCVLVVEDNVDVGTFAVQALKDLGYVPVLANDAQQALAELAKDADRFDVVFSDVVMPGMSGIDLAHEIRRRHHDLPVLLASGYSHVLAQNGTYGFELLHKPYSVEQLSRRLRQVATWQRRQRIANGQSEGRSGSTAGPWVAAAIGDP